LVLLLSLLFAIQEPQGGITGSGGISNKKALQFNGSSDYVVSSAGVVLGTTQQVSWSFWGWNNTNGTGDALFAESSANYNNFHGFLIDPNSGSHTGNFEFAEKNGGVGDCTFPQVSAATWHHYLLTMDVSGVTTVCTAYVDGTAQTVTVNSSAALDTFADNKIVNIMCRSCTSGPTLFNAGKMADFAIYSAILTATDATNLASGVLANSGTISASPVAYWHGCSTSSPMSDVMTNTWNWTVNGTTSVTGPSTLSNC
jgi:hypothetical protein